MAVLNRVIAQDAERGALPALYAATVAGLPGGSYVGPDGPGEWRGSPRARLDERARERPGDGAPAVGGLRAPDRRDLRVRLTGGAGLTERVERWIADDPDPEARAELRALLDAGAAAELEERFAGGLSFGTAGLRGRLGAGPTRMNVATVRRASAGLAALPARRGRRRGARPGSSSATTRATGPRASRPRPPRSAPAPACARSAAPARARRRRCSPSPSASCGCAAGVMVTASHNPAQDNGYKVYLGDGAQITPPADARIAAAIDAVGPLADVPLGDGGERARRRGRRARTSRRSCRTCRAAHERDLRIVYTPLHGVGGDLCLARARARRLRAAARRRRAGRARSRLPDRPAPQPGGGGRARPRARRRGARGRPTSCSPTTPTPTASRSRSPPRAAAGAGCTGTRPARCWPTSCSSTRRTRPRAARHDGRVVDAARPHGRRGGRRASPRR